MTVASMNDSNSTNRAMLRWDRVVRWFLVGGVVGFLLDLSFGILFEISVIPMLRVPDEPRLSYGFPAMVWAMLCGIWGGVLGASSALWIAGTRLTASGLSLICSAVIWSFTQNAWDDSIARYGRDLSDYVVFGPCWIVAGLGCVLAVTAILLVLLQNVLYLRS